MADVFISYKREDRPRVEKIADMVEAAGFSVWWDDRIGPQAEWDTQIEQAINTSRAVIVLWTPLSVESKWVRAEAHNANDRNCLVPAILQPCDIPIAFSLNQTVDLSDWDGDTQNRQWKKMMAWVEDIVRAGQDSQDAGAQTVTSRHGVVGKTKTGEDIIDGAVVTARTPGGTVFSDGDQLPVMRVIPAGTFAMGAASEDLAAQPSETPQHMVNIGAPYALGLYPVTQNQWQFVMAGSDLDYDLVLDSELPGDAPVTNISWDLAKYFAHRLSQKSGEIYRLPSEAEWEFACRAGTMGPFGHQRPFGPDIANYDSGLSFDGSETKPSLGHPSPVGTFPLNPFGLGDMHGNVREWVEDTWHDNYTGAPLGELAWTEGHSPMRVVRGGGWIDGPDILRSSARTRATQKDAAPFIGFRIARTLNLYATA